MMQRQTLDAMWRRNIARMQGADDAAGQGQWMQSGPRRVNQPVAPEVQVQDGMHALSAPLRQTAPHEPGRSHVGTPAEEVLAAGQGACQDLSHVFIACARAMGVPGARCFGLSDDG